jgi:hypothetical protein
MEHMHRHDESSSGHQNGPTPDDVSRIAKILGATADRTEWESFDTSDAGLDLLADALSHRLASTGGRPTDPTWTLSRRVPFKPETWEALQNLAEELGMPGRSIAPGQLAATLVEERVAELDAVIKSQSRVHHRRLSE